MVSPFGVTHARPDAKCASCGGKATNEALFGVLGIIVTRAFCNTCLDGAQIPDMYVASCKRN
jgi:hypothetical protein